MLAFKSEEIIMWIALCFQDSEVSNLVWKIPRKPSNILKLNSCLHAQNFLELNIKFRESGFKCLSTFFWLVQYVMRLLLLSMDANVELWWGYPPSTPAPLRSTAVWTAVKWTAVKQCICLWFLKWHGRHVQLSLKNTYIFACWWLNGHRYNSSNKTAIETCHEIDRIISLIN